MAKTITEMVAVGNEVVCALPQINKTIAARILAISPNLQQIKIQSIYDDKILILPVANVLRLLRKSGLYPGVATVVLSRRFNRWVNATVLAVSLTGSHIKVVYPDRSIEIIPRQHAAWLTISPYIKNPKPTLEEIEQQPKPSNSANGRYNIES